MTVHTALLLLALVCFVAGAAPAVSARVNLVSLGLAFCVLSFLMT